MSLLLFLLVRDTTASDNDLRWNLLERRVQRTNAARAYGLFRAAGIEPILIKGIAAAANYPAEVSRRSVDMDLAVDPAVFTEAARIAAEATEAGLAIDLHRGLRHLDVRPWDDLFDNSRVESVEGGGEYRVLRPEDHLRVLAVHWLNDGGIYRERLWDVSYLVANRDDSFDWQRVTAGLSDKRARWIECVLGLCSKYLSLDLSNTPFDEAVQRLPAWFTRTLESEWAESREMIPLWLVVRQPAAFIAQLRMRLDPNPIQATIQMEGSLDAPTRLHYKIGNFVQRSVPSLKRNVQAFGRR